MSRSRTLLSVTAALSLMVLPGSAVAHETEPAFVFGLDFAPNGAMLLTDTSDGVVYSGPGGDRSVHLHALTDVSAAGTGSWWATRTSADPNDPNNPDAPPQALFRIVGGRAEMVADLRAFEEEQNPHAARVDSNPFDVQALGGRAALVADAAGNDLLRVDRNGDVDVLAVLPDETVPSAHLKSLAGCPDSGSWACGLPPQMPAEAVATSVAIGPDGAYYVGELKGFPAPTGMSRVWRIAPDASWEMCPSPRCQVVLDGFTSIIDLAFDDDGMLHVAELDENTWAGLEIFHDPLGGTINRCDVTTGACTELATGVPMLTAIAFDRDGTLHAVRNALDPDGAEVFTVTP